LCRFPVFGFLFSVDRCNHRPGRHEWRPYKAIL